MRLVEVPNGDSGDAASRQRGVDVEAKTRRGATFVEAGRPHVAIFDRPVVVVDQI